MPNLPRRYLLDGLNQFEDRRYFQSDRRCPFSGFHHAWQHLMGAKLAISARKQSELDAASTALQAKNIEANPILRAGPGD